MKGYDQARDRTRYNIGEAFQHWRDLKEREVTLVLLCITELSNFFFYIFMCHLRLFVHLHYYYYYYNEPGTSNLLDPPPPPVSSIGSQSVSEK
ncbi:hypothetical protein PO909_033668 [Leuciscus waleckii]